MLSGVILSGGQSMRMGQEKGLIEFGDAPLVRHVAATIQGITDELVVSVGVGMMPKYEKVLGRECVIIEDSRQGVGPLEGLINSFGAARGDYAIVSPCDTPFLKREICETVLRMAKGNDAAVPVVRGYFEPLHGAYKRRKGLKAFEQTLKGGMHRPTDALDKLELVRVEEEILKAIDPGLESFWNLNSPTEIRLALERLGERGH